MRLISELVIPVFWGDEWGQVNQKQVNLRQALDDYPAYKVAQIYCGESQCVMFRSLDSFIHACACNTKVNQSTLRHSSS